MHALYQLLQPWVKLKRRLRTVPRVTVQADSQLSRSYSAFQMADLAKVPERIVKKYLAHRHSKMRISLSSTHKRLAIVVPYRKREEHRKAFTDHMLPFLQSKGIEARVHIINQADDLPFNRGALCNTGFRIASNWADYVAFHDIDLLPLDADYRCVNHPVGLVKQANPSYNAEGYFGAALLFRNEDFVGINGFSNDYWHWGWEDVDLRDRCYVSGLLPIMQDETEYRFLSHKPSLTRDPDGTFRTGADAAKEARRRKNRNRDRYLRWAAWGMHDHLNEGVNSLQFDLLSSDQHALYTQHNISLKQQWTTNGSE